MKLIIALLALVSSVSATQVFAAGVERVDVKKQIGLATGDYVVSKVEKTPKDDDLCKGVTYKWSKTESQQLCSKEAVQTVGWNDDVANPILTIGMARTYGQLNKGLQTEPKDPNDSCTYSHNTQSASNRLINDDFSNCKDENVSTHTTIDVKDNVLEYFQVTKVTKGGKVVCIPLKCTLTKK